MSFRPRGRGRGGNFGGQNVFQQSHADGDDVMMDARDPNAPRGSRGRGRGGAFHGNQQAHFNNNAGGSHFQQHQKQHQNQGQGQYQNQNQNQRQGQAFLGSHRVESPGSNAFQPRGRGRGGFPNNQVRFNNQNDSTNNDRDQTMRDQKSFSSRGRGRGRGHYEPPHQRNNQNQGHQIQRHNQPQPQSTPSDQPATTPDQEPTAVLQLLQDFLTRRYNPSLKLLDLSAIATDASVLKSGMFAKESTQAKFIPALMAVIHTMLPTREAKDDAIHSVSLANNGLANVNAVFDVCKTLSHVKALDLSGNTFPGVGVLKPWKGRFKALEHLLVGPFAEGGWEEEVVGWFPKLQILNDTRVRPEPASTGVGNNNNNINNAPEAPIASAPAAAEQTQEPDDQRKQEMLLYVQQQTNLKQNYALQCLEAAQWDINRAGELYQQSQGSLPPEAWN